MSSDETNPEHGREERDDNILGALLPLRIYPHPVNLASFVWQFRQSPDWSPEKLENVVKILQWKVRPRERLEDAIKQVRALAALPLNEETEEFFRGEREVKDYAMENAGDWPERTVDDVMARARRELQAQKAAGAPQASKSGLA